MHESCDCANHCSLCDFDLLSRNVRCYRYITMAIGVFVIDRFATSDCIDISTMRHVLLPIHIIVMHHVLLQHNSRRDNILALG